MKLTFGALLVAVVLIGLGVGGAFAGGVALGERRAETKSASSTSSASALGQSALGQAGMGQGAAGQQGRLRQFLQGTPVAGAEGAPGMAAGLLGRMAGTGTVEKVEGKTITISGAMGPTTITLADGATVMQAVAASLTQVEVGSQVMASGTRNDDGTIAAPWILVLPAGLAPQ